MHSEMRPGRRYLRQTITHKTVKIDMYALDRALPGMHQAAWLSRFLLRV